ncbi:MAG: TlyA family RNA methyltransferase [Clostridia bacterium]|nr:TlyA family RNA methyltransferase [Clostridia bacterium]
MRLDKFLSEQYGSRTKAAAAISKKLVLINGKAVQPSYEYKDGDKIEIITAEENYVSAGGFKLSKAIKDFNYSATGKIFADIGASTGGFTDCLLRHGAKKVYCIDVGESQLDKSLLDKNVVIIDNYNARDLNASIFSEKLDGVVIDVSFISLTYILEGVSNILDDGAHVLALIKPQFECESRKVGKNGIVRGIDTHRQIINKVLSFAQECNLIPQKLTNAPIISGKNMEYIVLLEKNAERKNINEILIKSVKL